MISKLTCKRCHHQWIRRKDELPRTCPKCKSPFWDKEKGVLQSIKYVDIDNIIELNKAVIRNLPIKKADTHKVLGVKAIMDISNEYRSVEGDVWDKASYLLKELIKKHPFASGNRRTALSAAILFLESNGQKPNLRNHKELSKTLQGIREDYYSKSEIKDWLMRGEIREFNR